MYKKIRAFLCLILALSIMAMPTTAFATENSSDYPDGIPEYAEKHEVIVTIPASADITRGTVHTHHANGTAGPDASTIITTFATTERYVSFEFYISVNSGTPSGSYSVNLKVSGASIGGISTTIDDRTYKSDDFSIDKSTYSIVLNNKTTANITVHLTYYTWS